jgi:hypothetical protein
MPHVVEINEIEALESYRLVWASLLNETCGATFFHSLDWLQCYWRHFGDGQRLRVLVVSSGARVIGILPLVVRTERTPLGKLEVLTYPPHVWGSFYGPLGPNPTATLLSGCRHLQTTDRDWDSIDLRWTNKLEHDGGRTSTAMSTVGFTPREQVWNSTAIVDFDAPPDEYFASREASFCNDLRRIERRARQSGVLSFERYRPRGASHGDADPRWELFGQCVDLALRSWQGPATNGASFCHDTIQAFVRDTHAIACKSGGLDLSVLRLDGRPIAFAYNYRFDGAIYSFWTAHNPAYSALAPGDLMLMRTVQDSFERGDRYLDLGVDSTDTKSRWATRVIPIFRYTYYSPTSFRGQMLRMKQWWAGTKTNGGRCYFPGSRASATASPFASSSVRGDDPVSTKT